MKKLKNNQGITLIALIITIIILVILAAVSIRAVTNMGIVGHAINGTQDYARGTVAEKNLFDRVTELLDNTVVKINGIQDGCGVTLNKDKLGLQLEGNRTVTEQLTATVVNLIGDVEWSSSDEAVAKVSDDGLITAVGLGNTVVTATVVFDGKAYIASCEVTITDVPVTSVDVTPASVTINKGGKTTLTAEVGPENVTDRTVTWTSGDEQIATVDANGVVTAVAGGTTQITARANDGSGYSAKCTVTVNVPVTGLALYKSGENANTAAASISATVEAEDTLTLVPVFTPNDASNQSITWSSNHENIATVANGVVTGVAEGTATITATSNGNNSCSASCTVTVSKAPVPLDPTGERPLVNKDTVSTYVTGTDPLEGEDEFGNPITIPVGFKVAADSGNNVTAGIVIEDDDTANGTIRGNQYVWIPTGTIYTNEARTTSVTITPGRYEFADGTATYKDSNNNTLAKGTPILKQSLANYATQPTKITYHSTTSYPYHGITSATNGEIVIKDYFYELSTYRSGRDNSGTITTNRTATNLSDFATSVANNGGYYIARYEASWGTENKVKSRKSTSAPTSAPSSRTNGQLWNFVNQVEAAEACQGLYDGKINSDLMNSYAWDTAIVFMQTFDTRTEIEKATPYSYQTSINGSSAGLKNTGNLGTNKKDEVCKVNDMASNCYEWTTEYSTYQKSKGANPCVIRGGVYSSTSEYTASRGSGDATFSNKGVTFRPTLYL